MSLLRGQQHLSDQASLPQDSLTTDEIYKTVRGKIEHQLR